MSLSMILRLAAIGLLLIALGMCIWMLASDKKLMRDLSEIEKYFEDKMGKDDQREE